MVELGKLHVGSTNKSDLGELSIPILVPKKGEDYFTEEEITQLKKEILDDVNSKVLPEEEERKESETTRDDNEQIRIQNEITRIKCEDERIAAETERNSHEINRIANEQERIDNEKDRIQQEKVRDEAEEERNIAEINRRNNESTRIQNETERITQEVNRISSEAERQQNEIKRKNAEEIRKNYEEQRIANEKSRVEAEIVREKTIQDIKNSDSQQNTKIAELEDKMNNSGNSNFSGNYDDLTNKPDLSNFVTKEEGKGLSTNDLTDELLEKLINAGDSSFTGNYDDLTNKPDLSNFVTKEEGKGLSSNDYTTEEKTKLETLKNYDDTALKERITSVEQEKVDKIEGKGLTTCDFTTSFKNKLAGIESGAQKNVVGTVVDANYVHTDNNYTTEEKEKLAGLENYNDTQITEKINNLETDNTANKADIQSLKEDNETNKTNIETLETENTKNKSNINSLQQKDETLTRLINLAEYHSYLDDYSLRKQILAGTAEGTDINIDNGKEYDYNILELQGNTVETVDGEKSPNNSSNFSFAGGNFTFNINNNEINVSDFPQMRSIENLRDTIEVNNDGYILEQKIEYFETNSPRCLIGGNLVEEIDDTWLKVSLILYDDITGASLSNCKDLVVGNFLCNWLDNAESAEITDNTYEHGYLFINDKQNDNLIAVIKKSDVESYTGDTYYEKVSNMMKANPFKLLAEREEYKYTEIEDVSAYDLLLALEKLKLTRGNNTITDTSGFYKKLYYMKNEIESKNVFSIEVVEQLPDVEREGVLYLVIESTQNTEPEPTVNNLYPGTTYMTAGTDTTQHQEEITSSGVTIAFNGTNFNLNGTVSTGQNFWSEPLALPFETGKTYQIYLDVKSGDAEVTSTTTSAIMDLRLYSDIVDYTRIVKEEITADNINQKFTFTPEILEQYYLSFRTKDGVTYNNLNFDVIIEEVV